MAEVRSVGRDGWRCQDWSEVFEATGKSLSILGDVLVPLLSVISLKPHALGGEEVRRAPPRKAELGAAAWARNVIAGHCCSAVHVSVPRKQAASTKLAC